MLHMIKYYLKDYTLTTILAFITFVVVILVVVMLIRYSRTEKLRNLSLYIDGIPLFAGLIAVIGFLTQIHSLYRALISIHASGTGDPRVVAAGFQEFFFYMTVTGGLFFIFLEAWLVVRMIYRSFIRELEMLPNESEFR